jgi:hypothetical protein
LFREIGPDLFRATCRMGLEGLVSKRRDRPYQAGRSKDWRKIKNRAHPAFERVKEGLLDPIKQPRVRTTPFSPPSVRGKGPIF